ncbi:MAG: ABC transporter permease [Magnetococcales bacterium]|nr:ABC transporter permease [Magnetococcales bacterium]
MIRATLILARREWIRFFRQPHRVIGSLAQPLLIWAFLGAGFSPSFRTPGMEQISYTEYFYPGILLMLMLFSGIFSTITLIEDRAQGLMQGVLVSPAPRMAIVMGKVIGGIAIAGIQTLPLLLAAPLLDIPLTWSGLVWLTGGFLIATLGFTALGFLIAWNMESTAGFHAVMSVFLMPMWMLSGALFPLDHAPMWLKSLMIINPVTHALTLIRTPLYHSPMELLTSSSYWWAGGIAITWASACLVLALWRVNQVERGLDPARFISQSPKGPS